jgi:hypothetical protein
MYLKSSVFRPRLLAALCALALGFVTPAVHSQIYATTPVNVFGDGNPQNGVEDSREQILGGRRRGISPDDRRINAGTLKCDGKIRGTAMVINTQEIAPDLDGVVLVTAAHVLFDLDKAKLFRRCDFHFLALDKRSRYKVKIDLKQMMMGDYDPTRSTKGAGFGEGDWAFIYAPKPWKGYDPQEALVLLDFSFLKMESYQELDSKLKLIAYDASAKTISICDDCSVVESNEGDLGGGSWAGQLLDDCDSGGGASGGGIVAEVEGEQYLVGIRNGSHWDELVYPVIDYPDGPPQGSVWDLDSNTNFGRAIDAKIMLHLQQFALKLEQNESGI